MMLFTTKKNLVMQCRNATKRTEGNVPYRTVLNGNVTQLKKRTIPYRTNRNVTQRAKCTLLSRIVPFHNETTRSVRERNVPYRT